MLEPIVKTIEVPCSQEKAFGIFLTEMGTWWPPDQRSMSLMHNGKPAKSLRVESRLGGQIIETASDDAEHLWGTIKTYDPFDYVSMDFHMGLPPDTASLLEIRFTSIEDERTQVELTHSNWEGFGDMAEMMYKGYGSSWSLLFEEAYASACRGESPAAIPSDENCYGS